VTVAELSGAEKIQTLVAQHELMVRVGTDVRDPYPYLAKARHQHSVLKAPTKSPTGEGVLVLAHHTVQSVLRDATRFSSSVVSEGLGPSTSNSRLLVSLDDPDHRVQRALVAHAFNSSSITALADRVMLPIVDELIDKLEAGGRAAELVAQLCFAFPVQVIAAMLGLPRQDYVRFQQWTTDIVGHLHDPARGVRALAEMQQCVDERIESARVDPGDDVISALVHAEVDGERLSPEDIYTFVRLLLPAGVETTFRSIGNLLFLLLQHRAQLDAVRGDPARLVPRAVEETLRFEVPMLVTNRIAADDCELDGVAISARTGVLAVIGAANRDEQRYDDPDRFDIERDPQPHISFGFGPHLCLGLHLARTEMRVALEQLLTRLPDIRLAGDADAHIEGIVFRGPTQLRVVW
jgi:cytochrome P450